MNSGVHSHNACPKVKLWTLEFIVWLLDWLQLWTLEFIVAMHVQTSKLPQGPRQKLKSKLSQLWHLFHSRGLPWLCKVQRADRKIAEPQEVPKHMPRQHSRGNVCRGNTCRGNICLGNNRRLWLRKGCRIILIPWAPLDLVLQWNLYCLVTFLTQICVVCSMTRRWLTWVVGHCRL